MKKQLAIYPGSFNPFTKGHLNILNKAEAIFGVENVLIAVGENPAKDKNPRDDAYWRKKTIELNLPTKRVESFSGFLTDFIWEKEKEGYDVTIIRGLRNGDDLDYEVNQLRYLQDMKPDMKTIFIVCDQVYEHISSSGYRACELVRAGSGHRYIAKEVESMLKWYVIIDYQSVDNYAMMLDAPKNKEYLHNRVKVFYGLREDCEAFKKDNPYVDFNKEDYEIGTNVTYDKEYWKLYDINEKECHLTNIQEWPGKGIFVQRHEAPWIWKYCKKKL